MIKLTEAREMITTTWFDAFRDSPRIADIQSVFNLIEKLTATVNEIWKKTNDTWCRPSTTAKSV